MTETEEKQIWSNTDFPYMCLKDTFRTESFRDAIRMTVKPGDVVIDVGAGTGILSFFAAEAGADKVLAVEIEPLLAASLRKSVIANGLEEKIEVIEGDIFEVSLPKNVDVAIAELIETGLLDELQVPVLNSLQKRGVIGQGTQVIPSKYSTFLELIYTDNLYYGYKILAPKHEWPFYSSQKSWYITEIEPISNKIELLSVDFNAGEIKEIIDKNVRFVLPPTKEANGLRLSGIVGLTDNIKIGPTNALNGDKIIPINPLEGKVELHIRYTMGGGLGSLKVETV